jgi:hypothetical protein
MRHTNQSELKNYEAYQAYLTSIPWDFFCTLSTDYELTPKSARRLMDRYCERLKQTIYNNENGFLCFWVAEKFKAKDGCHIHTLIKQPQILNLVGSWELDNTFQIVSGAKKQNKYFRTDIEKYEPKLMGARYFAKDLKYNNTAYDLII